MEYMPRDLRRILNMGKKLDLTEKHVITIMFNILCAVEFLHSTNLMHRDCKPANLLVDDDCQVRICDFGSARPVVNEYKEFFTPTLKSLNVVIPGSPLPGSRITSTETS